MSVKNFIGSSEVIDVLTEKINCYFDSMYDTKQLFIKGYYQHWHLT